MLQRTVLQLEMDNAKLTLTQSSKSSESSSSSSVQDRKRIPSLPRSSSLLKGVGGTASGGASLCLAFVEDSPFFRHRLARQEHWVAALEDQFGHLSGRLGAFMASSARFAASSEELAGLMRNWKVSMEDNPNRDESAEEGIREESAVEREELHGEGAKAASKPEARHAEIPTAGHTGGHTGDYSGASPGGISTPDAASISLQVQPKIFC
jgi:hypothetical protein